MSKRRKNAEMPVSLFSLQDIITSLCGIMILLVLLLGMHASANAPATGTTEEAVRSELDRLEDRVVEMESRRNTLNALIRSRSLSGKSPQKGSVSRFEAEGAETALMRELVARTNASKQAIISTTLRTAELTNQLERVALALATAKRRLSTAEATRDRKRVRAVAFLPADGVHKRAILVECSGTSVGIARVGEPVAQTWLRQNASDEFRRLLKSLDASNDYFVFLMKPSGLELARSLLSIAVKSGFEVGYDALEEDETLVRR